MSITTEASAAMDAHRLAYEALKEAGTGKAPRALPAATRIGDAPIDPANIVTRETVPGGWYTLTRLNRCERLRIVNTSGTSCVALFAWNSADTTERLNHADTMKIQWTAALAKGRVIFSDMGRVILSIVEDTSGAHDALAGGSTAASNLAKYGVGTYRNTRDNAVQGVLKLGLSRADIGPCISFFSPVTVGADGTLGWRDNVRQAGDFVDLRAEIDLMLLLSNAPHPLDPNPVFSAGSIDVTRFRGPPVVSSDLCRTATPEALRGFENTERYLAG